VESKKLCEMKVCKKNLQFSQFTFFCRHEYLLADKNMSIIPVAFSLMASFMSAISLMGLTREIYTFGTQFIAINFGYVIGTPLCAYLFLPVFFRYWNEFNLDFFGSSLYTKMNSNRQNSASAYAYLERRFNFYTRLIASVAFSIQVMKFQALNFFTFIVLGRLNVPLRKFIA